MANHEKGRFTRSAPERWAKQVEALIRSRAVAEKSPSLVLESLLGPDFKAYRRAWAAAEAGLRPEAPLHLDLDVTTACNFACPMCPAGADGHNFPGFEGGRFMDRALFSRALAEGRQWKLPSVRLGMTGEPLLIADIDDWAAEAGESGVLDLALITNGRLLSPEMSARLIRAGLTRLMVSVDAAGPETYARTRPGGDWNILMENLAAFVRLRREAGTALPLLRISFVEMAANQDERAGFIKIFEPLADYLSFQNYLNILGRSETDFSPAGTKPVKGGRCLEPLTRMAVHADGGLFPCCADFGRTAPLGRLDRDGIRSVWLSAEALALGRGESAGFPGCRACLNIKDQQDQ